MSTKDNLDTLHENKLLIAFFKPLIALLNDIKAPAIFMLSTYNSAFKKLLKVCNLY